MSLTNRVGLLAGFATVALSGVAVAETPATNGDAMTQIAELKKELAELKAQQGDSWLTEQRAAEIRNLVQDVLADADGRASLQSSGMTAGWDKGFFLASPDGNFKLRVNGQIQFRYILNYRDLGNNPQEGVEPDNWKHGFENRRTKLAFTGNIVDKTWTYKVQGNFSRGSSVFQEDGDGGFSSTSSGGSGYFNLEDAWVQKDFDNGIYLRIGQYKAPYMREELVSSARQLTVERSLVNSYYGQTYTQGASVGYQGDQIRAEVMYSDGIGRNTSSSSGNNFWGPGSQNTPWQQPTTEWAVTGRAEFMAAGEWKQFDDFTSWNGEPFGLLIGVAANWQRGELGGLNPGADSPDQQFGATADVSAEFGGANLYGAVVYSNGNFNGSSNDSGNSQWGIVAQGGIFVVPDTVEIFGRYEWADPDTSGVDDLSVLTAGVNWYFAKHAAKLTVDFGFTFQDFGPVYGNSGAGWINAGDADEYVLRAQFQLLF